MGSRLLVVSYLSQGVYIRYSRVPENRVLRNGVRRKWRKTGLGVGLEVEGEKESHLRSGEVEEKIGIWVNENVVEPGARSTKNGGVDRGGIRDCQ